MPIYEERDYESDYEMTDNEYYQCRNGNEVCYCQECNNPYDDNGDYYEDEPCQCDRCTGYSESEEEQDRLEVFKKLCDFFQLPKVYSNMEIKDFHNTDYISDYEFAEQNNLTKNEIISIIRKSLNSIYDEKTALLKKINVMIFFQIINQLIFPW